MGAARGGPHPAGLRGREEEARDIARLWQWCVGPHLLPFPANADVPPPGGISPIGRFWKGRRETNVTLNSITAKYGAMSPASAERNAVPIKPVSPSSRSNGSGTSAYFFHSFIIYFRWLTRAQMKMATPRRRGPRVASPAGRADSSSGRTACRCPKSAPAAARFSRCGQHSCLRPGKQLTTWKTHDTHSDY